MKFLLKCIPTPLSTHASSQAHNNRKHPTIYEIVWLLSAYRDTHEKLQVKLEGVIYQCQKERQNNQKCKEFHP